MVCCVAFLYYFIRICSGNPLVCDDKLDPLVKYLVTKNVRTFLPDQQDVVCAAPPKYAGTRLKELMIKKAGETFNNTFNGELFIFAYSL
jgi:hypothetical protein